MTAISVELIYLWTHKKTRLVAGWVYYLYKVINIIIYTYACMCTV